MKVWVSGVVCKGGVNLNCGMASRNIKLSEGQGVCTHLVCCEGLSGACAVLFVGGIRALSHENLGALEIYACGVLGSVFKS